MPSKIGAAARHVRDDALEAAAGSARMLSTIDHPPSIFALCAGVSTDDIFRDTKEVQAVSNAVTEEVTKLAEKKKAEIETA